VGILEFLEVGVDVFEDEGELGSLAVDDIEESARCQPGGSESDGART
jgi:hypothetical protein